MHRSKASWECASCPAQQSVTVRWPWSRLPRFFGASVLTIPCTFVHCLDWVNSGLFRALGQCSTFQFQMHMGCTPAGQGPLLSEGIGDGKTPNSCARVPELHSEPKSNWIGPTRRRRSAYSRPCCCARISFTSPIDGIVRSAYHFLVCPRARAHPQNSSIEAVFRNLNESRAVGLPTATPWRARNGPLLEMAPILGKKNHGPGHWQKGRRGGEVAPTRSLSFSATPKCFSY